jgi:hypothetical protein
MLYSSENIEAIANGDISFVKSIIEIFIETSSSCVVQINKGIELKDGKLINYNAHQLKPSIDLLEINDGKELVRTLETESMLAIVDFDLLAINAASFSQLIETVNAALKSDFSI